MPWGRSHLWMMMNIEQVTRIVWFVALLALAGCGQEASAPSAEPVAAGQSVAYKQAAEAAQRGEHERAYALYVRAAEEQGDAMAHFALGLMFDRGDAPAGAAADEAVAACEHFEAAAEGGLPYAQHLSGDCLRQGVLRAADIGAALRHYQLAASGGHTLSSCTIAEMMMSGEGMEKDPAGALALCGPVAANSPPAMVVMARLRLDGDESVRDYAKALAWLSKATAYEQPEAYYHLGRMSEMGMLQNYPAERTYELFEKAAQGRYTPAYLPSGRLYLRRPPEESTGALSADDLAKGYMWLSAARIAGDVGTQAAAERDLAQVQGVMPESWRPDLDARVQAFLEGG